MHRSRRTSLKDHRVAVQASAGFIHQFRNSLNALHAHVDLIREDLKHSREPIAAKDNLKQLDEAFLKVETLLKQSQRHDCLKVDRIKISDLLTQLKTFMRARLESENVEMVISVTPNEPTVLVNEVQLFQALLNLIINSLEAVQFARPKEIRVHVEILPQCIEIKFIDNGRGVPEDVAARIGQPLVSTKSDSPMSGLGLPIAKQIIEDHGGTLSLVQLSRPTIFLVQLPLIRHKIGTA
jgi:C4-dicarboxylate-specific signal transduction histidine kinase